MLVRLRSGTIGLLAVVTAVGLGLVLALSQQGWPDVASGPLPPRPPAPFVQHATIALPVALSSKPTRGGKPARTRSRRSGQTTPTPAPAHVPHSVDPGLAGLHQAAEPPSQPTPTVHPHSLNTGAHEHSPPASAPPPATTVAATPPATDPAATPPAESPSGPVVATADPENENESPEHHGWHYGHYPYYQAGSPPPWWSQNDEASNDNNVVVGDGSTIGGDDSTCDNVGGDYRCKHERSGWVGH